MELFVLVEDPAAACPAASAAGTPLLETHFSVAAPSVVLVSARLPHTGYVNRANLDLYVDGGALKATALRHSETSGATAAVGMAVSWSGALGPGKHRAWLQSKVPNTWGCSPPPPAIPGANLRELG